MAGGLKKTGGVMVNGTPGGASGRVDFDREKFTKAIETKGYDVLWEKAMYCPNRRGPSPGDHAITCTICDGTGFLYFDGIETVMLMSSVTLNQQFYAFGRFDSGRMNVTAYPEFMLSFWDKLTLRKSLSRFTELIHRQPGTLVDKAKYKVLNLINATWVNTAKEVVIAGVGVDVTVSDDGDLTWASNDKRPDDREQYSVSYEYHPEYIITDLLHHIRDTQVRSTATGEGEHEVFPVQAVAQLNFLVRDEGEDDVGEDNRNDPFRVRG